jgi:hypothetical protein
MSVTQADSDQPGHVHPKNQPAGFFPAGFFLLALRGGLPQHPRRAILWR